VCNNVRLLNNKLELEVEGAVVDSRDVVLGILGFDRLLLIELRLDSLDSLDSCVVPFVGLIEELE
jgi:hypothetical protein